ncbi:dienelactone hydrolase family protein [Microbacterium hominis]|uniref:dienelactone hydrolase family protein n=1 Tax=Microbacterium TaxID=33882 RepID=UPI00168B8E0F|nr:MULTISPECIES: dienelactone hydrolase family protein [Microbacterium]QOC25823.1 dienelactone hydrolase family protein [Microbacterium hominis]QOC29807.1 dienelactone hydrolase family protein [Microbacterium hominis]QYF97803.1 dienelactone hydrolase family protein [Microbacterium sp. PAMC21962]
MTTYAQNLNEILDREALPAGGVVSGDVDYVAHGVAFRGYQARPAGGGPYPGVLVVHDWLGVTDYVRMRCDMLARLGYVAFAADVYGADIRPAPQDAAAVASGFYQDRALWRQRLAAAFERLLAEPSVDPARTAAIGYCFGGTSVMELARTGASVGAVVSFHGGLLTGPEGEAKRITAKVLVLHGAADPVAPDDALLAFENDLRTAPEIDWQVVTYANAMHAFTLPDANAPEHGALFDATAERRSWTAMKTFLNEVFD